MNIDLETVMLILFGIVVLAFLSAVLSLMSVWLKCWLAGAYISYPELIAMRLRKSPLEKIGDAFVRIRKHGIDMTVIEIETEYIKDPKNFDTYVEILIEEHNKKTKGEPSEMPTP